MEFRASSTGKCIKELVLTGIHGPTKAPESKEIFLAAGHDCQNTVIESLRKHGYPVREVENELRHDDPAGFTLTGHTDGVLSCEETGFMPVLVEVKAVMASTFGRLSKTKYWQESPNFKSYIPQMNSYMAMRNLQHAYLVVYNRNTSDIVSGLPWMHEQHKIRHDLVLPFDPILWEQTLIRLEKVKSYIEEGAIPECDLEQCWHCGTVTYGKTKRKKLTFKEEIEGLEKLGG